MRNALAVVVIVLLLTSGHADAWQVNVDSLSGQRAIVMEFNAASSVYLHLTGSHSNSRPRIGHLRSEWSFQKGMGWQRLITINGKHFWA